MPTDIKLDEVDGNWLILESAVLKSTASDFLLEAPDRKTRRGIRRALVHDGGDGLTINPSSDYPGGVTIASDLRVTGKLLLSPADSDDLSDLIGQIQEEVAELKFEKTRFDEARIDRLEQSITTIAALMNASVVPPWRTKMEVEEGDEMGILYMSAADLGLQIEWVAHQNDLQYNIGDVISIAPPPGSVVPRGGIVRVEVNLEG